MSQWAPAIIIAGVVILLVLYGNVATWAIAFWVGVFGTVAALIGPRKGYTPAGAFTIGAIFGIFGVAYLAIRDDV